MSERVLAFNQGVDTSECYGIKTASQELLHTVGRIRGIKVRKDQKKIVNQLPQLG